MINNTYDTINNLILKQISNGETPWTKLNMAYSALTHQPYSLLNQMALPEPGPYATKDVWKKLGGTVVDNTPHKIVYWHIINVKNIVKDMEDDDAIEDDIPEKKKSTTMVLKNYNVYHISQVSGVDIEKYNNIKLSNSFSPTKAAEDILKKYIENVRKNRANDNIPLFTINEVKNAEKEPFAKYIEPTAPVLVDAIFITPKNTFSNESTYYHSLFTQIAFRELKNTKIDLVQNYDDNILAKTILAESIATAIMYECGFSEKVKSSFWENDSNINNIKKILSENPKLITIIAGKANKIANKIMDKKETYK